ncbi:MAG: UDP-N-acetylglucosamine 2-epimerase (non-hydrolyzing) [Clostridiales bacterium]|nr:UDP-N-acetylglucosamine 2-epimerase (non-hydrolyzing) [Clostridiales bacterium]
MKKIKIMTVFGTRPEAIKMVPLVKELKKNKNIETVTCVTAQHREMLDQVLDIFAIKPEYDLNIMKKEQTLVDIVVGSLKGLSTVYRDANPDMVLVHGDTSTTFVGALAAFYQKIKVGHVEAGLRTFDKYFPYPEEMNRKLTGSLADLHFCPTQYNVNNLLAEGINRKDIFVTGNTVIDALKTTVSKDYKFKNKKLCEVDFTKRVLCVTAHRRENLGKPLRDICEGLKNIANNYKNIEIVYPVHLNPLVQKTSREVLGGCSNVHLVDPLDVCDMHNLMSRSYLVLTDSGGLQEEAPSLGKPVLVLRNETERPEAITAGTVKLAGNSKENVYNMTKELLDDDKKYQDMAKSVNPYGDGFASSRIIEAIEYYFDNSSKRPTEFNV